MTTDWLSITRAAHLISMVTFFAGSFYIVRLFVYHRNAEALWDPDRAVLLKQFKLMERRLWLYVTWPSLIFLLLSGAALLWKSPGSIALPYMQLKLGIVAFLVLHHLVNHRLYRLIGKGELRWSSFQLRLWNQGPTLFLGTIVLLMVWRDRVNWLWGLAGVFALGAALMIGVGMFRKKGDKPANNA
jgi:putative membrane protein